MPRTAWSWRDYERAAARLAAKAGVAPVPTDAGPPAATGHAEPCMPAEVEARRVEEPQAGGERAPMATCPPAPPELPQDEVAGQWGAHDPVSPPTPAGGWPADAGEPPSPRFSRACELLAMGVPRPLVLVCVRLTPEEIARLP